MAYMYQKSIGTKMNDLDLCLEVVSDHVLAYGKKDDVNICSV